MRRRASEIRRLWISRFLLSIYLITWTASSLHVHEHADPDFVCQDCANHVHHAGHLADMDDDAHDCLLCSFLALPYLPTLALTIPILPAVPRHKAAVSIQHAKCSECRTLSLRAPPCF